MVRSFFCLCETSQEDPARIVLVVAAAEIINPRIMVMMLKLHFVLQNDAHRIPRLDEHPFFNICAVHHLICSFSTPYSHCVNCLGSQRFRLCFFLNHTTNSSLISIVRTFSSLFFISTLSIVIWGVYFFVIIFGSAGGTRTRKPSWRQILSLLCIPIPPPRRTHQLCVSVLYCRYIHAPPPRIQSKSPIISIISIIII
jgi:hypothetical protein